MASKRPDAARGLADRHAVAIQKRERRFLRSHIPCAALKLNCNVAEGARCELEIDDSLTYVAALPGRGSTPIRRMRHGRKSLARYRSHRGRGRW
jgi:hypothetical protein